jgi:steroid delta-isomerase-like uncharacterized protein
MKYLSGEDRQFKPEADRMVDSKQLVQRFADIGNSGNLEGLDDIVADDFVRHCQATPEVVVTTLDEFKDFYNASGVTFPDQKVTMETLVSEGDRVAFFGKFSGTQDGQMGPFPPTGKRIEVDMGGMFRIEAGKIAELWVTWDNVAGLVQLGHFPPPA